ncbi:tetratricopeptide repeat protein [Sunxiuqinia elliptica]|uniref:Tetratricopeptide repeat protein n=1 Tax=Sunxiuqinia elliptica TaxID=655355 RepID=A0A1I2D355_9BACT|nr:hypothetical protein [Sunxiuqinia elliptica]SFE74977.1 hypothetical protein SAMN05216283_101920 [Sunxiuqinia elliptica]
MERSQNNYLNWLLLGLMVCLFTPVSGQKLETYQCRFFNSYLKGDMSNWMDWIQEIEHDHPNEQDWGILALQARYGLIGYYFGTGQKELIKDVLQDGDNRLDSYLEQAPNNARLLSLKAAFDSFKIGLAMYKAPFLGPKVVGSIRQAMEGDPNEPMAWLEEGNALYNRPALFGGDKKQAIAAYRKAQRLFEQSAEVCNYLKVLVEVFILKGYYETNQHTLYLESRQRLERLYGELNWVDDFLVSKIVD